MKVEVAAAAFAAAELIDEPRHERTGNSRLSAHQATHHIRKPRRVDAFGEIPDRPGAHRCDELFLVDPAGHDDDGRSRNLGADRRRRPNGTPRRVEIDDADVGLVANGRFDGGVGVAGLGAVRRIGQRQPEACPRREVIRGDEHAGPDGPDRRHKSRHSAP